PRIEILSGKGIPFVFLGNPMSGEELCWVEVDNETGAYQAVNYLIESGHEKIATISGSSKLVAGKYRLKGYKRALQEADLELDKELIRYADFTQEGAYKATRELCQLNKEFTAIFAANDLMAIGVIRALKEENVQIPEEIAVMGYDGIQIGEFMEPPLSTIKLPSVKMGRVAINLLLKLISGENINERQVLLSPRLLLRASA
ncbi:MAG TPA: substrate-binding domain-containing protein, partial [Halanaerobiales bacterium]|nr:substrate-binding domain-containing protein [Halanaerobiales bacterium]